MSAANVQGHVNVLTMEEGSDATRLRSFPFCFCSDKIARINMAIIIASVLIGAVLSVGYLMTQAFWTTAIEYSSACNTTVSRHFIKLLIDKFVRIIQ